MTTISKAIASNTTADVYVFNNTRYIIQEEPMPSWVGELLESMQSIITKLDQYINRTENLESPKESNSWEANSPQIEIPKEPINDPPNFSNFVLSDDHYPKDRIDYQYNKVRVEIPIFVEVDDPKEYLNEDMTSSLPKTTQSTNLTPRANSTTRCFNCRQVGHIKTNFSKLIKVIDDSKPLPTNDSKEFKLEDEIHALDKTISIEHDHIIHDIVLKKFASSYERYKTFIAFPRRYKILKPIDLVDTKIHPPKLLKVSFKFQLKNYVPFKALSKFNYNTYTMGILNYWGISTSFTILDLIEFHEHMIHLLKIFHLPILLKVNFFKILSCLLLLCLMLDL